MVLFVGLLLGFLLFLLATGHIFFVLFLELSDIALEAFYLDGV
jgi:hypothetical protein